MTRRLGLLVTDASPLITLAAAEALECLTIPGLRVLIPDMIYFEVTQDLARTGAEDIVQWARRHQGQVEIVVTSVFSEFQVVHEADPRTRSKGRWEQAALEVLNVRSTRTQTLKRCFCSRTTMSRRGASCADFPSASRRFRQGTCFTNWKRRGGFSHPIGFLMSPPRRSAMLRNSVSRQAMKPGVTCSGGTWIDLIRDEAAGGKLSGRRSAQRVRGVDHARRSRGGAARVHRRGGPGVVNA